MAEDEEREAAASAGAPGGAPAPDLAPAEPGLPPARPPAAASGSGDFSHESSGAVRRDDNPFSLRHFLKREGSQPSSGGSGYERTGARPKTYGAASPPCCEPERYRRAAAEPLGMPSLPDFVQDHILVEQAYLDSSATIDLDNLPDFAAFGREGGACSRGQRPGADSAPAPHLSLDLTESVSPHDRRAPSPDLSPPAHHTFPLDLPPHPGSGHNSPSESMRLPDFLPANPGRSSPDRSPGHQRQYTRLQAELRTVRGELAAEQTRRGRAEREAREARAGAEALRAELREARAGEAALRRRLHHETSFTASLHSAADRVDQNLTDTATRATDAESSVAKLKAEIKRLKEEVCASQEEVQTLRSRQHGASRSLRQATHAADSSLRELLAGLDRLRSLSSTLEPP